MKEIGEKIKEVRNKKGLTQEELAEFSKVNLRTIQRIENNESRPRGKTLNLICSVLELNPENIIESENQTNKKYKLFSVILISLMIIGSFLGWFTFIAENGEARGIKIKTTGWSGTLTILGVMPIKHWFVTLCSLSIGGIVISNAYDLVKKRFKYIIVQSLIIIIYSIFIIVSFIPLKNFNFEIGFFLVMISTIGLTFLYLNKIPSKK